MLRLLILVSCVSAAFGQDPRQSHQAAAERECGRITATIEKYLGPKFKGPVAVKVVTKQWMVAFARKQEEEFTPPAIAAATERYMKRLRQIPADYDLMAKTFEMLESGIAGLYDPVSKTYFVSREVGGPGSPMFTITATHELVHAYRDVDKDYHQRVLRSVYYDYDWAFAVMCVVEGDAWMLGEGIGRAHFSNRKGAQGPASELMLRRYAKQAQQVSRFMYKSVEKPPLNGYPRAITESLIGRYAAGLVLAAAVFEKGGKQALERAYDRPPRSMEQVLHPAKYLAKIPDEPVVFYGGDPAPALGPGWRVSLVNTFGEFDARVFFTTALKDRRKAAAIAAGWDGGRVWFCEKEGATPFVGMMTTWDTEADAREFGRAWADWASIRDRPASSAAIAEGQSATTTHYKIKTSDGFVVVRVKGRDVVIADGVPGGRARRVLDKMAGARRAERKPDAKPPA